MKHLEAVIFDVDGVLVDSYHAHLESWQALAAEHGATLTEDQFAASFGRTSREIIATVWPGHLDADRIQRLDSRKEALYREIIGRDFKMMEGAPELVDALERDGVRLAVGSSGPPENVDLVLDRMGRRERFGAVVTGLDVTRGKPDPEVFLLAARRLEVPPRNCWVIEDAPDGIEAARRAGMSSAALISTGRHRRDFQAARPDLLVDSLRDLNPDRLRAASR